MTVAPIDEVGRRMLVFAVRHLALLNPGSDLVDDDGLLLAASAIRCAGTFHAFAVRRRTELAAPRFLAAVTGFAARHRRQIVLWADEATDEDVIAGADSAGWPQLSVSTGMAITAAPPVPAIPPGVDAVRVADVAGFDRFADLHRRNVAADGTLPVAAVDHYASPAVLGSPEVDAFVVLRGGDPVSCALSVSDGALAGVHWVATPPADRGHGFGGIATALAARAGFARGAGTVVLQATDLGRPVYRRLGFEAFTRYRRYVVPGR